MEILPWRPIYRENRDTSDLGVVIGIPRRFVMHTMRATEIHLLLTTSECTLRVPMKETPEDGVHAECCESIPASSSVSVSVHYFITNSRPYCARDSTRLGLSCEHCRHHQIFTTAQPPRSAVSVDSAFRFKFETSVSWLFCAFFKSRLYRAV